MTAGIPIAGGPTSGAGFDPEAAAEPGPAVEAAADHGPRRPLVIGYGSTLRTDDGAGWQVARRLADDPRAAGAEVLARTQLTPELAYDVSRASAVVFVDASVVTSAGSVSVRPVVAVSAAGAWTHHVTPESLLALCASLYGPAPAATLVSIGAGSFEAADGLTPAVEAALPAALDAVCALIGSLVHA